MEGKPSGRAALLLSFPLAILVAITSLAGLFWAPAYAREKLVWAAAGMGGDAVNLILVVPVLVASAALGWRGSVAARPVWMGTLLFLIYNYVLYCLEVHFNSLFLVYCAGLGLSFYAAAGSLPLFQPAGIANPRAPRKTVAITFLVMAAAVTVSYLTELVPASLAGRAPASATDAGLITNPIHVLDLCFLVPALAIAGVLLLRGRALGFVMAPVLLTFLALMSVSLCGMLVALGQKGLAPGPAAVGMIAGLAVLFGTLLVVWLRTTAPASR